MAKKRRNYAVGYGRPPKATRFQAGQSGNPQGRPWKKRPSLRQEEIRDSLIESLVTPVRVNVGGKSRTVPAYRAIQLRLVTQAAGGDKQATKLLFDSVDKLGAAHEDDRLTWVDLVRMAEKARDKS